MIQSARDLAKAALGLLDLAVQSGRSGDTSNCQTLELAAAVLASHVVDWHPWGQPLTKAMKSEFGRRFPIWPIIREISNGSKHARFDVDLRMAGIREVEWEDPDFWHAPSGIGTLFIAVNGVERSVHSLTYSFCQAYLSDPQSEEAS